jgi:hydroxyacylglutathione hydrolase
MNEAEKVPLTEAQAASPWIRHFPVGPLQCNCTLIADPLSKKALLIDPGGDGEALLQLIQEEGFQLVAILHTHAHFDHYLASSYLHQQTGAPLLLHENDQFLWEQLELQCRMFGIPFPGKPDSPTRVSGARRAARSGKRSGTSASHAGPHAGVALFSFSAGKTAHRR